MTRDVVTVTGSLTVEEAFHRVQDLTRHYHAYPVVDGESELIGIFTFNDLKRALARGLGKSPLAEVASKGLVHAHPDHTLDVAMLKLGRKGVSQLPVVSRRDTTKLLGIVTMHDVVEALSRDLDSSQASSGALDDPDGDET